MNQYEYNNLVFVCKLIKVCKYTPNLKVGIFKILRYELIQFSKKNTFFLITQPLKYMKEK
jgi:hypothetical protein